MDFSEGLSRFNESFATNPYFMEAKLLKRGVQPMDIERVVQPMIAARQQQEVQNTTQSQINEILNQSGGNPSKMQIMQMFSLNPEYTKMILEMNARPAATSTIGKIQADIDAGLIDAETGAAALKKATTIAPVYDPVSGNMIYAGGQAQASQPMIVDSMEIPPEFAANRKATQTYIDEKARSAAGQGKVDYEREQNVFDIEKGLRGEFKDKTKAFIDQRDAFGRIVNSAKDPSGAGDLSLIFNYMKVLDPGSTVREGEFAQVGKAGGLPGEIQNMFNRVTGGERLTPEIRKDIVSRAGQLYQGAEEQTSILADEYNGLASQYGAKPERVVGKFGLPEKIKKDYESLIGGNKKVVISLPQYGDVTEDDILTTMQENNMTREQVLQKLGAQ
jgi:hypothetical protein